MKPAGGSTRMKASDFHPYILEIFDGYVHGKLTKREFIREGLRGTSIAFRVAGEAFSMVQFVEALVVSKRR